MIDRAVSPVTHAPTRAIAAAAHVFVKDRDSEAIIRQSLSSLEIIDAEFVSGDISDAIVSLTQKPSPRLLIVDISGVDDPVSRIHDLADVCEPNTGVVVIGDSNDIVLYRSLITAGVVEYFFKPLVSNLVTNTCNNVLTGSVGPKASRSGKLVFVLGVRGGVGATTVAVNAAWNLAETKQRWVMLLDLDLQNGDAALQLDATPSHALREAFQHPERVDKLFLERAVIHVDHRIDLLGSLEPLGGSIDFEESAVLSLLENLLRRYRYVFVDLPATVATKLTLAMHLPSTCVLVSNGSLVSAREVARWRAFIGPNSPERTTLHVLNRHRGPGSLPDAEFIRAAGQAPDIYIPYDREIEIASSLGTKGTEKCAPLRRGLAPLLRSLSGKQAERPRSMLNRIFG